MEVSVVKASAYGVEAAQDADLIISAGGDGTFLAAASLVRDQTPIIGINTDPVGSEGHLSLTGKQQLRVADTIDRFLGGNFRFFPRQRVRVTLLKTPAGAPSPPSPTSPSASVPTEDSREANFRCAAWMQGGIDGR